MPHTEALAEIDHRRESRFKPNGTATVKILGPIPGPTLEVAMLDVSGSGMRLRSQCPVPCGTPVEIRANDTIAHGSVCRCEPQADRYELGIQVSETAPAPQHYVDFRLPFGAKGED
jgi:hypothetical protein